MNNKDISVENKLYVGDEVKNSNTPIAPELPVKIVNLKEFTGQVIEILETIMTPEFIKLEEEDSNLFRNKLIEKYEDFYDKYYAVFKLLLNKEHRDENVGKLFNIVETLQRVQNGDRDLQKEEKRFYEKLNQEYIYDNYGGKEKFEKKMMKEFNKKK
jgi:hypothetical protein